MKNGTGVKVWAVIATVAVGVFAALWSVERSNFESVERRIGALEVTCTEINVELGKLQTSLEFIGKTLDKLERKAWPQESSKTYIPNSEEKLNDFLILAPDYISPYPWFVLTDHQKSKTSSINADGTKVVTSLTNQR